jgi:hypothetical protein
VVDVSGWRRRRETSRTGCPEHAPQAAATALVPSEKKILSGKSFPLGCTRPTDLFFFLFSSSLTVFNSAESPQNAYYFFFSDILLGFAASSFVAFLERAGHLARMGGGARRTFRA